MRFLQALRPLAADFLSTILFVAVYAITGNIKLGIAVGICTGITQILFLRFRGRTIDLMQWMSLALVVVLGGASLLTHDPRFIMVKPSVGAFAIGCVMLRRNWMGRYLPPIVTENLSQALITAWGYVWSVAVFALAAANLFVALYLGTAIWAWYTAIVPLAVQLSLFVIQFVSFRYLVRRNIRARVAQGEELSAILAHL